MYQQIVQCKIRHNCSHPLTYTYLSKRKCIEHKLMDVRIDPLPMRRRALFDLDMYKKPSRAPRILKAKSLGLIAMCSLVFSPIVVQRKFKVESINPKACRVKSQKHCQKACAKSRPTITHRSCPKCSKKVIQKVSKRLSRKIR